MVAHVQSATEHPILDVTRELQAAVMAFSDGLQEPIINCIKESETLLEQARKEKNQLEAEFTNLRERMVLENLARSKLTTVRKKIAAAGELIEDLEIGLTAAYKATAKRKGADMQPLLTHIIRLATDIRDRRGLIASAREMDRMIPAWQIDNLQAAINAMLTDVDQLCGIAAQLNGGEIPETIKAASTALRKQCAMVSKEAEIYAASANAPKAA